MDAEDAIFAALVADASVTSLVGTRVFKVHTQDPVVPYVVLQRIAETPAALHREASEIEEVLVQVTCFSTTHAGARALIRAIKSALDGQLLSNGDRPTLTDGRTDYDEATGLYRADADFIV